MLIGINAQKLFVTQDYRNAGVSRYIGEIARRLPLVPGDERYRLYTNPHLRHWPDVEGQRLAVVPTRLPTTTPVLRILWEQIVLPALALRDGVDVLHCPLNVRPVAARAPVVLTIHDLTFMRFPDRFHPLKQRYLASFTRYSARRARKILADSAATKRDVEQVFGVPSARVDVVYPAVDVDFRPYDPADGADGAALAAFRARYDLPERLILYQGTLEPRKNVDKLVDAYAGVAARG
ncbi:MAG: glycosyltransferase, partial [Chloroflexota bacterium]